MFLLSNTIPIPVVLQRPIDLAVLLINVSESLLCFAGCVLNVLLMPGGGIGLSLESDYSLKSWYCGRVLVGSGAPRNLLRGGYKGPSPYWSALASSSYITILQSRQPSPPATSTTIDSVIRFCRIFKALPDVKVSHKLGPKTPSNHHRHSQHGTPHDDHARCAGHSLHHHRRPA